MAQKRVITLKPIRKTVIKAQDHPNFQRAVQSGFVEHVPDGKRVMVMWNWELIQQVWAVDCEHKTIKKFCDHWGVHYTSARHHLKVADKSEADTTRVSLGRMILDEITLPDQKNIKGAADLISGVLGGAIDNIQAIIQYVSCHLINIGQDGLRKVNIKLPSVEVARLALIQKRAISELTRLIEVNSDIKDQKDMPKDVEIVPSKQEVPNQRDVVARITKGGVVEQTPADNKEEIIA